METSMAAATEAGFGGSALNKGRVTFADAPAVLRKGECSTDHSERDETGRSEYRWITYL